MKSCTNSKSMLGFVSPQKVDLTFDTFRLWGWWSDWHQSQCNSCFSCFVLFCYFFQCRDKNSDLWQVDSFAPHGFTTFFAGNVEGKRAGERLWLFPVSGAFFVNGHHSLNQEAAGPSVNRDHNIWTTQKRKMCRAAVVRLCMISISIAISCLTTRCYSISHSGPFNVSGIEHEDAWFPLQTSLGHNGHRPVPTADNCVVVFLSVCGCVLCIWELSPLLQFSSQCRLSVSPALSLIARMDWAKRPSWDRSRCSHCDGRTLHLNGGESREAGPC